MKLKRNIATSESGFIFNPSTGDSFSANSIGSEILLMLKENKSQDEIKNALLDKYEIEKSQLEKDFDDFMTQLRDHNLLENG